MIFQKNKITTRLTIYCSTVNTTLSNINVNNSTEYIYLFVISAKREDICMVDYYKEQRLIYM